ncbi:MAG: hydantoinase B/oxoprolinase family protein [Gammaproteobacteria bacterium]|nr:hydantoinase B/oxoprolinase family protein [Gammaproteobacteria bacterium]
MNEMHRGELPGDDELKARFLSANTLFLGPDTELLADHRIQARSTREERVLRDGADDHLFEEIRASLQSALDEGFEVTTNAIVSPAGKFGDMTVTVFTANGDLSSASLRGVIGFCAASGFPIRYVIKHFEHEPTVGVRAGDMFIMNDPFYGGVHSPDQISFMPVYHDGERVAWVAIGLHEGENGAREPGGMGPAMESPWDEGIKMPPIRVAENYRLKFDLVNYLQNSSRDPRLVGADLKVRLATLRRVEARLLALCDTYGANALVGTLRQSLEYVAAEATRRVRELPEGTVRGQIFLDTTMREDALIRFYARISVRDGRLVCDFRGSSPQFMNRPINAPITSIRIGVLMGLVSFIWPDLPRSLAILDPVDILATPGSVADATREVPTCLNMQVFFKAITLTQMALLKLGFGLPRHYGNPIAPWFNQPVTFIYGGVTQHVEQVGNLCADLNGMPGGAKWDADGEHSMSPNFAAYVDTGETELVEEDLPFVQVISKRLLTDNCGFGKFRGGAGYEFSVANRYSDVWGFLALAGGSKFSTTPGMFGGYGSPTYPISMIKEVDVFAELARDAGIFRGSLVDLMNERPFAGASYRTHRAALPFEMARKGELYLQSQGAGGGWGDVLDRDPALVAKDLEEGIISTATAQDIYRIVLDPRTGAVDPQSTEAARTAERAARLARSLPYAEFAAAWNRDTPPAGVPYYGAWGEDVDTLYAGDTTMRADAIQPIFMPDPREVRIAALEARLRTYESC